MAKKPTARRDMERRAQVLDAFYRAGNLTNAARELGISRERVRQVVTEETGVPQRQRQLIIHRMTALRHLSEAVNVADLSRRSGLWVGTLRAVLTPTEFAALRGRVTAEPVPCGTVTMYQRGCRCPDCRRANSDRCLIHNRLRRGSDPYAPIGHTSLVAGRIPLETNVRPLRRPRK